jgi:hypothetical protein
MGAQPEPQGQDMPLTPNLTFVTETINYVMQWVPGHSPGGKERPRRDADTSLPSNAMVLKE